MDPQILQQLGLTQDQIQAIMQLSALQEEKGIINKEMESARQLRQQKPLRGKYTGPAFVNSSPLSAIARGVGGAWGAIQEQQGAQKMRENAKKQAELRQMYLMQMLKNQSGATVAPQQLPQPPAGGLAPQMTPSAAGMFPMPAGGGPTGATMTPRMMGR